MEIQNRQRSMTSESHQNYADMRSDNCRDKIGGEASHSSNLNILWIINVPKNCSAHDLKSLLSIHGKVVDVKIVVNARYPGSCCFGYITMESVQDANNVVQNLNNTEFNGNIIQIDRFENIPRNQNFSIKIDDGKGKDDSNNGSHTPPFIESQKLKLPDSPNENKRPSISSSRPKEINRQRTLNCSSVLTFDKIKEEREKQRERDRERAIREAHRRRREEDLRKREREQRYEAQRLYRERKKLNLERSKILKEKSDLLKLKKQQERYQHDRFNTEGRDSRSQYHVENSHNRYLDFPQNNFSSTSYNERPQHREHSHKSLIQPFYKKTSVYQRNRTNPKYYTSSRPEREKSPSNLQQQISSMNSTKYIEDGARSMLPGRCRPTMQTQRLKYRNSRVPLSASSEKINFFC